MSRRLLLVSAVLLVPALSACSSSSAAGAPVTVTAGVDICTVAPTSVAAGAVTVTATYTGDGTGEVYLYAQENGAFTKILGEVEDLTSTPKSFTAEVAAGAYEIKCEGGGKERRVALTVTG